MGFVFGRVVRAAAGQIPEIDLDAEELAEARTLTPAQKFLAGAELFDFLDGVVSAGVRRQDPEFTPEQVREEFLRRMSLDDRERAMTAVDCLRRVIDALNARGIAYMTVGS